MATATLTGNVLERIAGYPADQIEAWLESSEPWMPSDTGGIHHFGAGYPIEPDPTTGDFSIAVPASTAGTPGYTFVARVISREGQGVPAPVRIGPFLMDVDKTLQQAATDLWNPVVIDEAVRLDIQAAAALGATNDTATASFVNDTGSATYAAAVDLIGEKAVREGSAFADIAKQAGVDPTGTTDSAAAIQTALDGFSALGVRAYAKGTFRIDSTVTITGNADLGDATFNYSGTGVAVQVGTGVRIDRKIITLPRIIYTAKPATGWTAGTIGLKLVNLNACIVTIPLIRSFEDGMFVYGAAQGNAYNTYTIGHLDNNKRNQVFDADSTGWSNSNLLIGGRYSHNSAEGTAVPGTRHILLKTTTNLINANTWVNPSVEGTIAEQMIDVDAGLYNMWLNPRLESSAGGKVRWGAGADLNQIIGGYASAFATVTRVTGERRNVIQTNSKFEVYGSGGSSMVRLQNGTSTAAPALGIYEALDLTTPAWTFSADKISGRGLSDAEPRIELDRVNGRVYFGSGAAALTKWIGNGVGNAVTLSDAHLYFGTDNTSDIGHPSSGFRPRYVRAATAVSVGVFTTAGRPTPATAGAGAMIFNSTTNKPNWSDGTNWRDATGAIV